MVTIEMKYKDLLVIDPCYIKHIENERYDALKLVKVLHEGDDGEYLISVPSEDVKGSMLGVDSGRIWVLQAEFDFSVDIDAGLSGFISIEDGENIEDLDSFIAGITKSEIVSDYDEDEEDY